EPDSQFFCFLEQRGRLLGGNRRFEIPAVELFLILPPPAREKGGGGELRKDDELRPHAVRLAQQLHHPPAGDSARVGPVQRAKLRAGDLQLSHPMSFLRITAGPSRSFAAATGAGIPRAMNLPLPFSTLSFSS